MWIELIDMLIALAGLGLSASAHMFKKNTQNQRAFENVEKCGSAPIRCHSHKNIYDVCFEEPVSLLSASRK